MRDCVLCCVICFYVYSLKRRNIKVAQRISLAFFFLALSALLPPFLCVRVVMMKRCMATALERRLLPEEKIATERFLFHSPCAFLLDSVSGARIMICFWNETESIVDSLLSSCACFFDWQHNRIERGTYQLKMVIIWSSYIKYAVIW